MTPVRPDPINTDLFKGIIREEIAAGKYLIMSSHQMATVEEFCTGPDHSGPSDGSAGT